MHDPVLVKRRLQQVVVRASRVAPGTELRLSRRRHMPTLLGLGARDPSPTLVDDAPPDSGVRVRRRPVVLLDGVDDELAMRYCAEADRILATGRLAELSCDYIGEAARILSSGQLEQLLAEQNETQLRGSSLQASNDARRRTCDQSSGTMPA